MKLGPKFKDGDLIELSQVAYVESKEDPTQWAISTGMLGILSKSDKCNYWPVLDFVKPEKPQNDSIHND